jgi:Na+/melibiose symporter-like transporter
MRPSSPPRLSLRQMLSTLFKTSPLLSAVFADTASTACTFILPAIAVYYYNNVAEKPALLSVHFLTIGICSLVGAYLARFITKFFNARTACLIIYPIISVLLFSTKFFVYQTEIFIVINGVLYLFSGLTQPLENNLYLDTATYSRRKTEIDAKNLIISISNLPIKFAQVVKSFIISFIFVSIGYTAGSVSEETKSGIITAYSVIPAIMPLIGWLALFFFYKLTPEKLTMMKEKIVQ